MNLVEKDLKYIWHPCSQMKDYEELKPMIIDHGKGVYLYDLSLIHILKQFLMTSHHSFNRATGSCRVLFLHIRMMVSLISFPPSCMIVPV